MNSKLRLVTFCIAAAAAALAAALPAVAQRSAASATTVTVTAGKPGEFGFKLSTKAVKVGAVTFKVTNAGMVPHSFKVCSSNKGGTANACAGKGTPTLNMGASATLTVTFTKPGSYEYLCTVAGHAAAGQKGILKVS
jgi:plastocyanin